MSQSAKSVYYFGFYLVLIFTALFFSSIALAQPYGLTTDMQDMNLKGKVGSILEKTYKATWENNQAVKGALEHSIFYKFDKEGNIVADSDYEPDGSIKYSYEYKFSKPGLLTEKSIFKKENKLWSRETREYNADNYLINQTVYDSTGKIKEQYIISYKFKDPYNYVKTTKSLDNIYISSITLDKNNNVIHFIRRGGYYDNRTNTFNAANLITHSVEKDSLGVLKSELFYEYDDKGNLIKQEFDYLSDNKSIVTSAYTYDEMGNWITKITKSTYDVIFTERKLDYIITGTQRTRTY